MDTKLSHISLAIVYEETLSNSAAVDAQNKKFITLALFWTDKVSSFIQVNALSTYGNVMSSYMAIQESILISIINYFILNF